MKKTSNFTDALATELQFAVLTKTGRIQILVKPTSKELRKRGKRGWELFGIVEQQSDSGQVLHEVVHRALLAAESADGVGGGKKRPRAKRAPLSE